MEPRAAPPTSAWWARLDTNATEPPVGEHRHRHVDVGQMRAAGHVRVVGDEQIAFGDVVAVAGDQDAHQLEQGGQVDRQRHLGLRDQPPVRVGDCRGVVVALLDVGGEGALLDGDPGLVVDRLEAVPDDLQRDGVERGWAHASTSISRLPLSATVTRLPGGTSVVASNCVTTSGPSSTAPGASVPRVDEPGVGRPVRGEPHGPRAARIRRRDGLPGCAGAGPGAGAPLARAQPHIDDLDGGLGIVVAVFALMRLQERALQPGGGRKPLLLRHRDRQLEVLADVAHVDGDVLALLRAGLALARMPLPGRVDQPREGGGHGREVAVERTRGRWRRSSPPARRRPPPRRTGCPAPAARGWRGCRSRARSRRRAARRRRRTASA